jgi:hypothetical protein
MYMQRLSFILTLLVFSVLTYGQTHPAFYQSAAIDVYDSSGNKYLNAFGGGLKFPVFASLDLNNDGKNDLLALDKSDNRLLPFIYMDSTNYIYRPQYESGFPYLEKFIILKDYNGDNLPDLFTFASENNSGIKIYKNISSSYTIAFEKVVDQLHAHYFNAFWSLLYLNSIDVPAIVDMDADGDLDILTFGVIGMHMEYYENMSMDYFGHPDSFHFEYADQCWGKFEEDELTNEIFLGKSCEPVRKTPARHAGSTSLVLDLDEDDDFDLLLGDVEYPGYYALVNGKNDFSWPLDTIISYDKTFPSYDVPVNIKNMPAGFYIDVDGDDVNDLLVSPLDMEIIDTFQGLKQIWYYKNVGKNNKPDFRFQQNDFLQEDMLDFGGKSIPAFFDYDQDGDLDLFVSSIGDYNQSFYKADRLYLFENKGDKNKPVFHLVDDDYLELSALKKAGIHPAFGDMDGDGDQDLLLGQANGELMYFENKAAAGTEADFVLITSSYQSIDAGDYSAPCISDVDGDLLPDLLIGERYATIKYYKNTGSSGHPVFSLENDTFGKIKFELYLRQYSTPYVYDLNRDGKKDLIIGTRDKNIFFVDDFANQVLDSFPIYALNIRDSIHAQAYTKRIGSRLSVAFADLFNRNEVDMILGGERGGLLYYSSVFDTVNLSIEKEIAVRENQTIKIYPNPVRDQLHLEFTDMQTNYHVKLLTVNGIEMLAQNIHTSDYRIDVSDFAPGVYILVVNSENYMESKRYKILKMKK